MTVYSAARFRQYPFVYVLKIDRKKSSYKGIYFKLFHLWLLQSDGKMVGTTYVLPFMSAWDLNVGLKLECKCIFWLSNCIFHWCVKFSTPFPRHHSFVWFLFFLFPIFLFILIPSFSSPMTPHIWPSSLLLHLLPIHVPPLFFQFPANRARTDLIVRRLQSQEGICRNIRWHDVDRSSQRHSAQRTLSGHVTTNHT